MNKIKKNKLNNKYIKIILIILISLFIFVSARGFSSYLNQKKIKLEKEIHLLGSSIEWIKYEINDKISFSNLEKFAKEKYSMKTIEKEDIIYIPKKINFLNNKKFNKEEEIIFIESIL